MPPMTRRRSARIASASKTQAVPPTNLGSLIERDEPMDDLPQAAAAAPAPAPAAADPHVAVPRTPASSSPTKPSNSEMHPSKTHVSLAPPSSAVRLGFADIPPARRDSVRKSAVRVQPDVEDSAETTAAMLQATPSKVGSAAVPPSSSFTFRYTRKGEPGATTPVTASLSQEARRMMEELREKTTMIRADLEVERAEERAKAEAEGQTLDANGRRIAKLKSRSGRFSAAHTAEFEKMDSIANHPSAFRAVPGRFTPAKTATLATAAASTGKRGLKRTQSKASLLDETPKKTPAPAPVPASAQAQPQSQAHNHSPSVVKRLFDSLTSRNNESKTTTTAARKAGEDREPMSTAKRMKQSQGDDTSSGRPVSRDGSSLPRSATAVGLATPSRRTGIPRSRTMASLMTPTKSSLSRSMGLKTPSGIKTPSMPVSALKKPVFGNIHQTPSAAEKTKPASTVRLVEGDADNQGSKDDGHALANTVAKRCALPVPKPSFSKTPGPSRVQKALSTLPAVPATTPSRKLTKHVTFTPTTQRAVNAEKSPSLFRSLIPRSGTAGPDSSHEDEQPASGMPSTVTAQGSPSVRRFGAVLYPDLSKHRLLIEATVTDPESQEQVQEEEVLSTEAENTQPPSIPGKFTFRSDKTINFGEKPATGFGASPGQVTVRQVRVSAIPEADLNIPGSFPKFKNPVRLITKVATKGANKENTEPVAVNIPHGIANKKRHRVSEAEEAAEEAAAERAAKRRKNEPVAEGEALMAPRLMGRPRLIIKRANSPFKSPQKPVSTVISLDKTPVSVTKKRTGMSMSRLNSLAQPKYRK